MEKFLIVQAGQVPSSLWTMRLASHQRKLGTTKFMDGIQYTLLKAYPYLASLSSSGGYTNRYKFIAFKGKTQLTKWAYFCNIDQALRFDVDQEVEVTKETENLPAWLQNKFSKLKEMV